MSILLVYNFQPNWMFYVVCLLILPFLVLYMYFHTFFLESPNYLIISKHDYASAIHIIKELAAANQATKTET